MTSFYDSHDYYKKMLELQEKLRKSEEERIRLDERFKILVQESRNRHDACINRLRLRYIEFLEEQRTRDERNHKLLEALDRVDNSLALMTSKTNRLNVLRKQYEAYLRQMYAVRSPPGSLIGNSDMIGQIEDRNLKPNVIEKQIYVPHQVRNISSSQMFRPNRQTSQSISPSSSKLTKSVQNIYYNDCQHNVVQLRALNQQINDSQNSVQMHPKIQQSNIQQLPSQSLSLQVLQQRQPYYNGNVHLVSHYFQTDPKLHVPNTSPNPQIDLLNRKTQRMETIQTAPHLVLPDRTNGNMLRYKPVDWTTPIIMERNVTDTNFLNAHLNLSKQPYSNYSDHCLTDSEYCHKTVSDPPGCSLKVPHDNYTVKHREHFIPKRLNDISAYHMPTGIKQVPVEENKGRTTMTSCNELDRYIEKIRKLHRNLDEQSVEGINHEQNISGDSFNTTLLSDKLELSTKNKREENFPKEVQNVLALADDLAFRMANLNDSRSNVEKVCNDKNRNVELIQATQTYTPISKENTAEILGTHEGRATSLAYVKDKNSSNIALLHPELDSLQNIGRPENKNFSSASNTNTFVQYEVQLPKVQEDENGDFVVSNEVMEQNDNNIQEKEKNERDIIYIADESKQKQYSFDSVEELEPWSLDHVTKQIKQIDLIDEIKDQLVEKELIIDQLKLNHDNIEQIEFSNKVDTPGSQADRQDFRDDGKVEVLDLNCTKELQSECIENLDTENVFMMKNKIEVDEISTSHYQELKHEDGNHTSNDNMLRNTESFEIKSDGQKEYDDKQKENYDEIVHELHGNENDEQEVATLHKEYNDHNFVQKSNQMENYVPKTEEEYTVLNEEYNYDQNMSYGSNEHQEYQQYNDKGYVQESDDQYEEYTSKQYNPKDQYVNNPENQYANDSENQYANDPENQYANDPENQYVNDPENQYANDPENQYANDPKNQYANDSENQYANDPENQYANDPENQYVNDPENQYANDPENQYVNDPENQYANDPENQYANDPENQYVNDPENQYPNDSENQYVNDPENQYANDPENQYVNDPENQYANDLENQYANDSENQYANDPENQYGHDSQIQYQEDVNQQYSYTYDQQYEPNQLYETNINQPYDPNQTEVTQEQEGKVDQEQNPKYKEQYEESRSQEIEKTSKTLDMNQSKSGKLSSEIELKKKKDIIKSLLDSDTDSTIERNISNTESDFDFN
ncbi:uncharacterized protein LOC143145283 [Ptiloglossa arizonensis]|uniref:uncharacterized protein LOC143145283 n=1 Tax=Ptiloglossa arizonensis TaxID=3350558 RepID=UPI003F9FBCA6